MSEYKSLCERLNKDITRLRAALAAAAAALRVAAADLAAVTAERDRMREALKETLAIARRNEAGDYVDRARAALESMTETPNVP